MYGRALFNDLTRNKLLTLIIMLFIIVPGNLYHTISSDNFLTHMGTGKSDLRIDAQQTDHIAEKPPK